MLSSLMMFNTATDERRTRGHAHASCTARETRSNRTSRAQGLRFRREAFSRLSPGTGNRPVPGENRQKPDEMAI